MTTADDPRVHVVTVMHNSSSTIESYFVGLVASADLIERVTVVDNASTDDTLPTVRQLAPSMPFPVEVIENANVGFAGGYFAARTSSAPRHLPVLCVNPDVVLAEGAVAVLRNALDVAPDIAVVTAPLTDADGLSDSASRRRLPTLGPSMLYAVLGPLTPARYRYNARTGQEQSEVAVLADGTRVTDLEATTGALMLVHPTFRSIDQGVFDTDYWMYGEDLQLCLDARRAGRRVVMAETGPSVHVKGVSAGRPRSFRSNRAFHAAMYLYARKNLLEARAPLAALAGAIWVHFLLTEARALPARVRRWLAARDRRSASLVDGIGSTA